MYASNASIKRGRAPWGWCVTSFVIIQGLAGLVYQSLSNMLYCGIVCEVSDKLECKRNSCSHSTTCNHIAIHNYRRLKPLCTEQLFLKTRMTGSFFALKYMILTEHARRCTYRCNKFSLSGKSLNCLYYGLIRAKV